MNLKNTLVFCLALFFVTSLVYAERIQVDEARRGWITCPNRSEAHRNFAQSAFRDLQSGRAVRGPAGGFIFYDRGFYPAKAPNELDCWRFLEAAPRDLENKVKWSIRHSKIGNTQQGIGYGSYNTDNIIVQSGYQPGDYAARECHNFVENYNGQIFKGWFLPSRDELNLMYELLAKGDNKGGFNTRAFSWYWSSSSSSESSDSNAWGQYFDNGYQFFSGDKGDDGRVRCVRAI